MRRIDRVSLNQLEEKFWMSFRARKMPIFKIPVVSGMHCIPTRKSYRLQNQPPPSALGAPRFKQFQRLKLALHPRTFVKELPR